MLHTKLKSFLTEEKSRSIKLRAILSLCIIIHTIILIFAFAYEITPLAIFNMASIFTYVVSYFFITKFPISIFYIAIYEIILHSFLCVILLGDKFGFSMYFIAVCPLTFYVQYSLNVKRYILKSTLVSIISFALYVGCYIISIFSKPFYTSVKLSYVEPAVYMFNMLVIFAAIGLSSVFYIWENEAIYLKLKSKNMELDTMAHKDALTGLSNRRVMTDHIQKLYSNYKDNGDIFSLIICDIDNFKKCNDTYGHDNGDKVLVSISNVLKAQTRDNDFLCRWGGEEFLIMLKNMDLVTARNIAERIRQRVTETDIELDNTTINVTMTFGLSCVSETAEYKELFKLADSRLYEGKKKGKNIVV